MLVSSCRVQKLKLGERFICFIPIESIQYQLFSRRGKEGIEGCVKFTFPGQAVKLVIWSLARLILVAVTDFNCTLGACGKQTAWARGHKL